MSAKYQTIADRLRRSIENGEYAIGSLLPTELELCDSFDASRQTIRRALQCLVEDGLVQRRQGSGTRVCEKNCTPVPPRTIAVITTYISDYIFPAILREAESVFADNNCTPMLFATKNQHANERRILNNLLSLDHLDGVLVEGTKTAFPNPNCELYRQLIRRGVPLVFMNGNYRELENSITVLDDNYGGGYSLVNYLVSRGHTRIAGIFKGDDIQGHQRYAGFSAAMLEHELPLEDANILWYITENKPQLDRISQYWRDLLNRIFDGCTAVVCYNDEVAGFVVKVLHSAGIKIPSEFAVVSFDNSRYSDLSLPPITSLSHGNKNVGRIAAETLLKVLAGENCSSQTVGWELIEKESC